MSYCSPSIIRDVIITVTSPGAAVDALPCFRIILTLSCRSPSAPCQYSSTIFFRTLSFILKAPTILPLALNAISTTIKLPLPSLCSSVSIFVAAVVAAEGLLKIGFTFPPPELQAHSSSRTFCLSPCLSIFLKDPPFSPLIAPASFLSSLSRVLSGKRHFSNRLCTSHVAASLASALKSRELLQVVRVKGVSCAHSRSQCMGVCEWALTMRVSDFHLNFACVFCPHCLV